MLLKTFSIVILLMSLFQPAPARIEQERISFSVPAAPWSLTLPKDGLVIQNQQVKPDGRNGYFSLIDERNNLNISFFIEPVKDCKDSKSCRDMIWKLGNPTWEKPQNVVQSQIGEVSYLEFFMPSFRGMPVRQQNMYAEFVKDGFWIDMHISKVLYKPEQHVLFENVIKSVKFEVK